MSRTPKFKSHLHVQTLPPDLVLFQGESGYRVLQGRLIYLIAPLINGVNTESVIKKRLSNQIAPFDIDCGLLLLKAEGVLHDSADRVSPRSALLRDSFAIDTKLFQRSLKTKPVSVLSLGNVSAQGFTNALKSLGLRIKEDADFTIVIVEDYLRRELKEINRDALKSKRRWMLVKPTGTILWLGPVFDPGKTACWGCLASRLKRNRQPEIFDVLPTALPVHPSIASVAASLCALEVLKAITLLKDVPLMTLDTRKMELQRHALTRLDDCPECSTSTSARKPPKQLVLKNVKKTFLHDGGHRSTTAEETFRKYEHHISPLTGIVDQVELYHSDGNGLIHCYVAGHLFLPSLRKQISAGKGITQQQAKTGALCEALERYSGVFRGNEFRTTASFAELGEKAIHPNLCMNFSERQYDSMSLPVRFDPSKKIEWSSAWSLSSKRWKYIPTAYCYYGYPSQPDHDFCRADSNGNAAGNTLEEAILHGLLELVERDAAALWWYNRAPRPGVNLDAFPYGAALREHYRASGLELWMLDITSDFQIPAFVAIAARKRKAEYLMGFGCHLDTTVALSRALTELNQFLRTSKRKVKLNDKNDSFLKPSHLSSLRRRRSGCGSSNNLRDDLLSCVSIAHQLGIETLVVDQTRPDVGMPVVKVIMPGMRQLWPRFRNGRLYTVAVKLGWIGSPIPEEGLNPNRIVL